MSLKLLLHLIYQADIPRSDNFSPEIALLTTQLPKFLWPDLFSTPLLLLESGKVKAFFTLKILFRKANVFTALWLDTYVLCTASNTAAVIHSGVKFQ